MKLRDLRWFVPRRHREDAPRFGLSLLRALVIAIVLAAAFSRVAPQVMDTLPSPCAHYTPDDWFFWWFYGCDKEAAGGGGGGAG